MFSWDGGRGPPVPTRVKLGPNCALFPRGWGAGGGAPPTLPVGSEGPANWAPGAGGPIALFHGRPVMSPRDSSVVSRTSKGLSGS